MKNEWFEELILEWDDSIQWEDADISEISANLATISLIWSGRVIKDRSIVEKDMKQYALERTNSILNAVVRSNLSKVLPKYEVPHYYQESDRFEPALSFLKPVYYKECLNINTATAEDMEPLPVIGPTLAERVVSSRLEEGPFKDLVDLERVQGLGEKNIKKLAPFIHVGQSELETPSLNLPQMEALRDNPTFAQYVKFMNHSGVSFSRSVKQTFSWTIQEKIKAEIEFIVEQMRKMKTTPFNRLPGIRASALKERKKRDQRVVEIELKAADDDIHGAVLEDSAYLFFCRDLLKTATKDIHLIMFFIRFEDTASYPTDDLIDELVAAKNRGVNVKIIMDRDAEGEVIGATTINQEAFDYFKSKGIDVRWDTIETTTHTKLLIVDDQHVVIGSHNWTAGSLYAYDDTSIYIHSQSLTSHYVNQFNELWDIYEV